MTEAGVRVGRGRRGPSEGGREASGRAPVLAGLAASAVAAGAVPALAVGNQWVAGRLAGLAWLLAATAILLGADRVLTVATFIGLGGAMVGLWPSSGVAWGSALLLGCLWFVAVAATRHAIAVGDGVTRSSAVLRLRVREVAAVVLATVAAVAAAGAATRWAPDRTLPLQGLGLATLVGGLLLVLWLLGGHRGRVGPATDAESSG